MPSNSNTPSTRSLRSNSQSDVTLANIKILLEESKNEIISSMKSEIQTLKDSIISLTARVEELEEEKEVLKQQHLMTTKDQTLLRLMYDTIESRFVALDSKNRNNTFIIRNFPEDECIVDGKQVKSTREAVTAVAEALGLNELMEEVSDTFRLGNARESRGRRLIMVKTTEKTSRAFLRKARNLKNTEFLLDQVYIQENLPPLVNKRLAEMRKRAYEHRKSHPGEEAFVKNKKLFLNGIVVDEIHQNF